MPEGDTIHHAATGSARSSPGGSLTSSPRPTPASERPLAQKLAGRAVESVDAHGKHLFLRFEGDRVIHSHLRMTGRGGSTAMASAGAARPAGRGSCCAPPATRSCSSTGPCSSS